MLDAVQIRRNFFPLGNPPYAKKCKRDSLYFDLLPGPFKSATLFFLFIYILNKEKRKTIVDTNFLFVCIFTHLIQFFTYIATFTQDHNKISLTQEHITEQG